MIECTCTLFDTPILHLLTGSTLKYATSRYLLEVALLCIFSCAEDACDSSSKLHANIPYSSKTWSAVARIPRGGLKCPYWCLNPKFGLRTVHSATTKAQTFQSILSERRVPVLNSIWKLCVLWISIDGHGIICDKFAILRNWADTVWTNARTLIVLMEGTLMDLGGDVLHHR